jgi:acetolactate synthase I/II/III large subunit
MTQFPIRVAGEAGFVLLISCAGDQDTGGGLCVFDGAEMRVIDRVSTAGLTVFEGRLARLLRTPLSTGGGEIVIYDDRGISQYLRVDELWDAHYLTWDGRNLIVASTGNNSFLWIATSGEVVQRWRAPGEPDSWHLNEACLIDGRLYGCAFSKSKKYRGYKDEAYNGSGFVFDVESGREVIRGLHGPHNPRYADGIWTVCDSLRERVLQFDANGGRLIREAQVRSFARGLALTDDFWIVGESSSRNSQGERQSGSIAILRRADLKFVERFDLPFSEVADIVVVSSALAQAAMTGFRTNPLRVEEADQLHLFRNLGMEPRRLWAVSERLDPADCRIRIEAEIPSQWEPGRLQLLHCCLTNLGETFLCSALPYPVFISYKWISQSGAIQPPEGIRTRLPRMIAPGDSIRSYVDVQAPETEGQFQLILTLVHEYVFWFDSIDIAYACCAVVDVRPAVSCTESTLSAS